MSSIDKPVTEDYLNRFGGIARLYGLSTLKIFSQSHIVVIGLGGVGSWAVESLVRSGIGKITLVDLDDLCITNINRQLHATSETIGQAKTKALAERISLINPEAKVTIHQSFYTEKNAAQLLSNRPDGVIDAIDSVRQKCHLLATCKDLQIPVITSGGAGGRTDATQIQIDDLSKTYGDALLLSVRKRLRSDYHFPHAQQKKARKFHIPAVFSPEQPVFPTCEGTTSFERPSHLSGAIKCDSGYGAATHLTATFGNLMCGWMLKQLAAKGVKKSSDENTGAFEIL